MRIATSEIATILIENSVRVLRKPNRRQTKFFQLIRTKNTSRTHGAARVLVFLPEKIPTDFSVNSCNGQRSPYLLA